MAAIAPFDLSPRTNVNPVEVIGKAPANPPPTESITSDYMTVFDVLLDVGELQGVGLCVLLDVGELRGSHRVCVCGGNHRVRVGGESQGLGLCD